MLENQALPLEENELTFQIKVDNCIWTSMPCLAILFAIHNLQCCLKNYSFVVSKLILVVI